MKQLIDLCGVPIQIKKIQNLQLIKRDYLFYPAYQEIAKEPQPFLKRIIETNKTSFQFSKMVPYGAILNEKEIPVANSHEIKHFGESEENDTKSNNIKQKLACLFGKKTSGTNRPGGVAGIAAEVFRIDTSKNRLLRVITYGHHLTTIRLGDIPAKIQFLSGKISDVYQHDQIQKQLGEPIAPVILPVPTLVVTLSNSTHVFFGEGIDLEDAEATYYSLLEAHTNPHSAKQIDTSVFQRISAPSHKRITIQNRLQTRYTDQSQNAPQQPALADTSLPEQETSDR